MRIYESFFSKLGKVAFVAIFIEYFFPFFSVALSFVIRYNLVEGQKILLGKG